MYFIGKFSANGTRVEIRKLVKSFAPRCQWTWKFPSTQYRRDKVALRTTCAASTMSSLRLSKDMLSVYYVGYLHNRENLNWAACGPRVGQAALDRTTRDRRRILYSRVSRPVGMEEFLTGHGLVLLKLSTFCKLNLLIENVGSSCATNVIIRSPASLCVKIYCDMEIST